jgi:adenosylhomocysteine nucleosidase
VVGLRAEARMLPSGALVEVGGGTPAGAEAAAARVAARGARGLVSFGFAGGLDPALAAGALVLAEAVVEDDARFATAPGLTAALGPASGVVLAAAGVVAEVAAKRAARAASGAVAVDLESGAVARVAAQNGLPFAVVRAISDPAVRALPPAALVALDARGRVAVGPLLASLLRRPGQIPDLVALARGTARARATLCAAGRALLP